MKIVFTGGETGGHFYPIIAVAEAIRDIRKEKKLVEPTFYFVAPTPYNEKVLFDNKIIYKKVPAGKMRIYFSLRNIFDWFITIPGLIKALWTMFWIYPDVVFSKGGYGSVPVVWAANVLGIPVIIHESDSAPGRANAWAGKKAVRIAVSYPEAIQYFDEKKTAWTGNPIRNEIKIASSEGAEEYLDLESGVPVILILGGSQGSKIINDVIAEILPSLVEKYQIIHQVGKKNIEEATELSNILLNDSKFKSRYRPFKYLDDLAMKMSAGAADLIISRAGSTIFEIANWKKPSILIPITESNNNHQRKNAYIYARTGAASVIEEKNLIEDILLAEIERILNNKEIQEEMSKSAETFAQPEAAKTIAAEVIEIALSHNEEK
jgi:UDP-N-acetylglucosamine--N-acetylmuramyl-(pentapeptide) pyrophosphoryl-undecaprenol N-acetylglucosamine transferase